MKKTAETMTAKVASAKEAVKGKEGQELRAARKEVKRTQRKKNRLAAAEAKAAAAKKKPAAE